MTLPKADEVNSYDLSPDQQRHIYEASSDGQGDSANQKYSREDLIRTHSQNIDLLKRSKTAIREFVLPVAYGPSTSSLDELRKISFDELKLESHHRGAFLTGRTIVISYQYTEITTLIEGENGGVAKLVLGFEDNLYSGNPSPLPLNSTVAIKEPYCKYNGGGDFVIRVDHPSDIAVLRGDDPAVKMIMQFASGNIEMTPLQWRLAGDRAYLEKKYSSSIEWQVIPSAALPSYIIEDNLLLSYTQALDNAPSDDVSFVRDTRRKRAFANLTAKAFMPAKEDALASCSRDILDLKAYYCAGRAAYELGTYKESKSYFEQALQLSPNDSKNRKELIRAETRIQEEQQGTYDFKSMVRSVTEHNIHLDHADYAQHVEVRSAATHGRGLFSTQLIKAGSLVLCERAFCLPDMYCEDKPTDLILYNFNSSSRTQRPAQAALFLQLKQKLYENPHLNSRFFDLDGGSYVRSGKEGQLVDGVPVIDSFLIEAIRLKNCFSCPPLSLALLKSHLSPHPSSPALLSTGLWIRASYINHSCLPNCTRAFIGDMMVIHANSDIPPNTELTQQYLAPEANFLTRREEFPSHWDFDCDCPLCTAERRSPDATHLQRRELVGKIKEQALKSQPNVRIPAVTIKTVERLTKKLQDLHEPDIYGQLPRLLLVHPTIWLTEAHRSTGNHTKVVKYALEVLRNFGFVEPVRDGRIVLSGRGITNSESFNALRYAAMAYRALGKSELAGECEDKARSMFRMLTGSEVGVEEVLGGVE